MPAMRSYGCGSFAAHLMRKEGRRGRLVCVLSDAQQKIGSYKHLAQLPQRPYNRAPVVGVAQLVELRIVIPAVAGSNPVVHPS